MCSILANKGEMKEKFFMQSQPEYHSMPATDMMGTKQLGVEG